MRMRAGGFYTEDLQSRGFREGFRIVTLDGEIALLAATGHPGPVQVSKYGVDLQELERVGVRALHGAPAFGKEFLQQCAALLRQHAANDFGMVIQLFLFE